MLTQQGAGLPAPSPRRGHRRLLVALLLAVGVAAGLAPVAGGHALVRPAASRPADLQLYTMTVPTERDVPTVRVDLAVPDGISFVLVQEAPGWSTSVVRRDGRIAEIRWTNGTIPPDHLATFRFVARNPVIEGEISWRVVQRYQGGEVVRWIGDPDSETPASRTAITETAVPVDVLEGLGGGSTPGPDSTADPAEGNGDEGSDTGSNLDLAALVVAALGTLLALFSIGVALVALRRSTAARPGEPRAGDGMLS